MVNVMVSHGDGTASTGAPVVEEHNPTYGNLIGRIEHIAQMGTLVTDFLLIKPGALHRANGGYLLLDARRLLLSPFAWEALEARHQGARDPHRAAGRDDRVSHDLDADASTPSPFRSTSRWSCSATASSTTCWPRTIPTSPASSRCRPISTTPSRAPAENDNAYARLIASIVKEHGLKPVDASGVARIIDEGARLADDREKLSIEIGRIADIVREADYWSGQAKRKITTRQDVARAIEEQIQRADRLRDRAQETINRGVVLVDTDGAEVGPDQRAVGAAARLLRVRPAERASPRVCASARAASPTSSARPSSAVRCTPRA